MSPQQDLECCIVGNPDGSAISCDENAIASGAATSLDTHSKYFM